MFTPKFIFTKYFVRGERERDKFDDQRHRKHVRRCFDANMSLPG